MKLGRRVRRILKGPLLYSDLAGLLDKLIHIKLKVQEPVLLIIMYHEISKDIYYERGVSAKLFEDELRLLLRLRFEILPLCEALEVLNEEPGKHRRIAVLTFDDAYKGVYEIALPIMLKYGIRGTIFPVAGFIETRTAHWAPQIGFIVRGIKVPSTIRISTLRTFISINNQHDKDVMLSYLLNILPKLDVNEIRAVVNELSEYISNQDELGELFERVMMNFEQLNEASELGFEVGGHGYWHVGLTHINKERLYEEIEKSLNFVNKIMKNTYVKARTFAYPYGLYNNDVVDVLKEKGFSAAVTMIPKVESTRKWNLYELGRIPPYGSPEAPLTSFKVQLLKSWQ